MSIVVAVTTDKQSQCFVAYLFKQ